MGRLDGRVAFITGAGRGIGAATALRMAEEGARVALADVDTEGCKQVAAELDRLGMEGLVVTCNVADSAMVQDAVDETASHFGRLDILVNNAGVVRDNLLFKMSEEDWDTVMNVHLKGAFLCTRAAQAHMVQQKYGRIVSLELGPFGITVNAVAPGYIDTEMTRATARRMGLDPQEMQAEAAKRIPVRRVGQPRDIANVICFLCSDEASFVNGQIIYVSGGPSERG